MKFFILLYLCLSCANLKHATSTNFQDFKSFHNNESNKAIYNQKVKVAEAKDVTKCKELGDVKGGDNAFDQGPEYAVLYMKVNADKIKADTIVVLGNNKVGDYGNEAFGKAYQCEVK